MSESNQKLDAIKGHLKHRFTAAELDVIADECYAATTDQVVITSISSEGQSTSGQLVFEKWITLQAINHIRDERTNGRQMADVLVRSGHSSPV